MSQGITEQLWATYRVTVDLLHCCSQADTSRDSESIVEGEVFHNASHQRHCGQARSGRRIQGKIRPLTLTSAHGAEPGRLFHETVKFAHATHSLLGPSVFSDDARDFFAEGLNVLRACCKVEEDVCARLHKYRLKRRERGTRGSLQ